MAWRHVFYIFQEERVDNVVWVWAPHPSYKYFDTFYPGDDYVDYVGLGVLNFGTAVTWSKWWGFKDLFGKDYPALSKFNKPIMLAEFGSLNVGGNRAQWFADALRDMPEKYPLIKSILYFHYPADETLTNKKVSWYFIEDQDVLDSIKSNVAKWEE
jgi:beta-mannanase